MSRIWGGDGAGGSGEDMRASPSKGGEQIGDASCSLTGADPPELRTGS